MPDNGFRPAFARVSGRTNDDLLVLDFELNLRPEAALFEQFFGDTNALRVPDRDDPPSYDGVLSLPRCLLSGAVSTVSGYWGIVHGR